MHIGQTQRNLVLNIFNLLCNVAVGFYYTPYLVRSIGVAAYGIVPLALIVNQLVSVMTGSLTGALTRFYSIALQQKDYPAASRSLSSSFFAITGLIIFLLPLVFYLIYRIQDVFNIPVYLLSSAKLLFLYTIISFFLSLYSSIYNVSAFALNKLDYLNTVKILRVVLKLFVVILLFEFIDKEVSYIGLANAITEFIVLIYSYYIHKLLVPNEIIINIRNFSKASIFAIGGMTLWTIVHQIGDVGIYRLDNAIVNKLWGTALSGALGAVTELGNYITMVLFVLTSLFAPIILIAYSNHEHIKLQRLVLNYCYLIGVLSAISCGLVIGYSSEFLCYWLGASFAQYQSWLILKLLPLPFFICAGTFSFSNRAWNLVKGPAISTVIIGIINVFILILLAQMLSLDSRITICCMLLFEVLVVFIQSYVITAIFFLKPYPNNKREVLLLPLKVISVLLCTLCITSMVRCFRIPDNIYELLITLFVLGILIFGGYYFFIFNEEQKNSVKSIIISE